MSGSRGGRVEDEALLRGAGCFSDDAVVDGMAACVFVRSPHAHARIAGIGGLDEARRAPGVVAVLTNAGLADAGIGNLSRPPPLAGRDGQQLIVPHRPPLAEGRVVHIGEMVVLVVAETLAAALDAADLVDVDYEPLLTVTEATDALAPGAPQVWPQAPGNLAIDWSMPGSSEAETLDPIFESAAHVVRIEVMNQRISGAPLETRGATALYDAARDHFTLHAPTQGAHVVKAQLCGIFDIEPERLRVLSPDVGGAFGLKTPPYPEYVVMLAAAKMLGRPLHWMATRSEAFLSDHHSRDTLAEAQLALDADGRFLALKVSSLTNLGAYLVSSGALIATISFAKCFPCMYDIAHVSVDVRLAFSNTVPTGAFRGAGRPEANYLMERLVDAAAAQTGIDPIALRRRNLIPTGAMPYHAASGNVYDSGAFDAALSRALELADMDGLATRRREAQARGRLRGIGISCFLEHAGGGPTEGAVLAVEGDKVNVRLGMHPAGQGHATLFAALAAADLGIEADQVVVEQGDSDLPIKGGPAVGSRTTNAAGKALNAGVKQLIERACELAADMLAVDEGSGAQEIAYSNGYIEAVGTNRRISLFELAGQLPEPDSLTVIAQVDAVSTYPNGCHIAEVEVDPETGRTELAAYVAVDDCGKVLNHALAQGQVYGGVAQGIGQAMLESIRFDETGQLLTGSLMDYAMPRADDLPPIVSVFQEVACTTNPLGVKGLGESGTTAALAAVMNAIANAIPGPAGAAIDMPATPEKVWRACGAGGGV